MKILSVVRMNPHHTRYFLEGRLELFIDRDSPVINDGYRYALFQSGAGQFVATTDRKGYRIAALRGGGATLSEVLAIADKLEAEALQNTGPSADLRQRAQVEDMRMLRETFPGK